MKFEDITFYNLFVYHYKLHDKQDHTINEYVKNGACLVIMRSLTCVGMNRVIATYLKHAVGVPHERGDARLPHCTAESPRPDQNAKDLFNLIISSSSSFPIVSRILSLLTATILSTMIWEVFRSPLSCEGSMVKRNGSASCR